MKIVIYFLFIFISLSFLTACTAPTQMKSGTDPKTPVPQEYTEIEDGLRKTVGYIHAVKSETIHITLERDPPDDGEPKGVLFYTEDLDGELIAKLETGQLVEVVHPPDMQASDPPIGLAMEIRILEELTHSINGANDWNF